jgi:hypothetical protein
MRMLRARDGRSTMRALLFGGLLALVVSFTAVPTWTARWMRAKTEPTTPDWAGAQARALTVLRSDALAFLVTDRLVTQVVTSSDENSALLGRREGYLVATVRLYYGVDLEHLSPANLRREVEGIVVTVPEPRELDFAVDMPSLRFMSKRNVTMAIADWLRGRDLENELRSKLRADALAFMKSQDLIPARGSIVTRLNAWAPVLSEAVGVNVRFE